MRMLNVILLYFKNELDRDELEFDTAHQRVWFFYLPFCTDLGTATLILNGSLTVKHFVLLKVLIS